MTHPFEKRRLREIVADNVSNARDMRTNSIMANRKPSRAFQRAVDGVRTLPRSLPKGGSQTPIFQFFGIKFNFNRIKSATKFRYVKTSVGRVIEQSISYEINKNIGWKVFTST